MGAPMANSPKTTSEPWDSPLRRRRIDYETRQDIASLDWNMWEWIDVTTQNDPNDVRVYARIRRVYRDEPV